MDKHPRFASKKIYDKLDDSFLEGILIRHQTCPEDEGHNQIGLIARLTQENSL